MALSQPMDEIFDSFPPARAAELRAVRDLILELAAGDPEIGDIVQEVKWQQPSFATRPKTGTPLRLGLAKNGSIAVFVHCQTRLMADLGAGFHELQPLGARGVAIPDLRRAEPELRRFILGALRYHL